MGVEARILREGSSDFERKEEAKALPITRLKEAVELLDPPEQTLFWRLFELVDDRFTNDGRLHENGSMRIPDSIKPFVFNQFKGIVGSNDQEKVVDEVSHQWTVTVTDRYAKKQGKYNPLREARPIDRSVENPFLRAITENEGKDPFCNPEERTPEGTFGRLADEYGTSCANLTKFSPYHEVLIGPHNPYDMHKEHFVSQMSKALKYGQMVYTYDNEARHLTWGMNFGYRGGASQVHQHSQVIVDRGTMHHADVEEFHEVAARYRLENPGREYLADWLKVHEALGLAEHIEDPDSSEGIWIVMPLTPSKERNVVVISSRPNGNGISDKFKDVCWGVVEFMMNDESVMEFNTKFYMTPFGRENEYWQDYRPMFTFVDRGVSTTPASDMGFMETSRIVVLSTDPKKIAPRLSTAIQKYLHVPLPTSA